MINTENQRSSQHFLCFPKTSNVETERVRGRPVDAQTGNKNVQLVFNIVAKRVFIAMLRVLPPTFEPVLLQIRLQGFFSRVVKHAKLNVFCCWPFYITVPLAQTNREITLRIQFKSDVDFNFL